MFIQIFAYIPVKGLPAHEAGQIVRVKQPGKSSPPLKVIEQKSGQDGVDDHGEDAREDTGLDLLWHLTGIFSGSLHFPAASP